MPLKLRTIRYRGRIALAWLSATLAVASYPKVLFSTLNDTIDMSEDDIQNISELMTPVATPHRNWLPVLIRSIVS